MSDAFFAPKPEGANEAENNQSIMIDIETMGTVAGSPIVTIGAVLFDPFKCDSVPKLEQRALLIRIDVSDAVKYSIGIDGGTLRWWLEQEDSAIKALVGNDCLSLKDALLKLNRYFNERGTFVDKEFFNGLSSLPRASSHWAKDPDFDMVLLRYAYERLEVPMPWKFHEGRSVRTIQDLAWPEGPHTRPTFAGGTLHDARADAINQALMVQAAMVQLGLSHEGATFSRYEG